jgi:recombination protein RecA
MSKKKGFDLNEYKKSIQVADTPLKMDLYVQLNDALQSVLGLPGLPLGHITQIFGKSDSGKTSLVFHAVAQAQKQGILCVLIITEGKVSLDRMKLMGINVDNCIIVYVDHLEDIFMHVDRTTADVVMGKLPMNTMIFVDSIGNTISVDSITHNKDGTSETGGAMMKAAKVIREKMRVFSHKINNTRKVSSPFTVGLVFINHAYTQPPAFPGAQPSLVPYGGEGIWLASSLVIRTKKSKTLKAVVGGQEKGYGIVSKITVDKNHISNTTNAGEFVVTGDTIIPNEKSALDAYKELHKGSWTTLKIED